MNNDDVRQSNESSVRRHSFHRMIGKTLQFFSRRLPFIPASWRVRFQQWRGVRMSNPTTVFLGEDVYFDSIYPELISLGQHVRITAGARILSHFLDTSFVPEPNRPFRMYTGRVVIGSNVFIGFNVVIAKPVEIGDWAVIGANTVVTQDVPRAAIVAGSPARIVGYRNIPELKHDSTT
jgi:acetyltransferase-like isoleucine patch superfamily enzyme